MAQTTLFGDVPKTGKSEGIMPLAGRMRPRDLDEFVGQGHLLGEGRILRNMIEQDKVPSMIFWGPPGVGKTTLAGIIANRTKAEFVSFSAVTGGTKEVKEIMSSAEKRRQSGRRTVLFVDEIHRFNKAQQDALLGAVENGTIILIGATTENPSFEVITPLLSRCQVFVLKPLEIKDLQTLLDHALKNDVLLRDKDIEIRETEAMFRYSGGDGRKLLNVLEIVVDSSAGDGSRIVIDNETVTNCLQENMAIYDKDGEMHYDIISAFIKSIRGSDPNAAVYYLARMLDGGEDPLFIARRLCISASEDVGLANPNALLLANSCYQIVHQIGMPEARIPLSETTIYLASSPKSNATYLAINKAIEFSSQNKQAAVPLYLRNAPTKLMEELGYADGYKYAHDFPGHFADLEFMPEGLEGTVFYEPASNPQEDRLKAYLQACWPKYYSKK